jgi:hypothetical protein
MATKKTAATPEAAVKTRELTNSMRNKFASCHRAYKIAYNDLVRPAVESDALSFGTAMHALLEGYWGNTDEVPTLAPLADPYKQATLEALYAGYCRQWGDADNARFDHLGSEIRFDAPLMNPETGAVSKTWHLAGKIDAMAKERDGGKVFIVEHKTTSQDIGPGSDYWRKIPIDGQVSGYFVGAKANGFEAECCLYDVIRKPTIKPLKATPVDKIKYNKDGTVSKTCRLQDETPDEWKERLSADIAERPEYYFARLEVVRSETDLAEYLFDMWAVGREIADAEKMGRFSRNPLSCSVFGTCEYFDVCTGCASLDDVTLFKKIDTPNPELEA